MLNSKTNKKILDDIIAQIEKTEKILAAHVGKINAWSLISTFIEGYIAERENINNYVDEVEVEKIYQERNKNSFAANYKAHLEKIREKKNETNKNS